MVARDQANQGAAVLHDLGRPGARTGRAGGTLVYLHGGADVKERDVDRAPGPVVQPGSVLAAKRALAVAGVDVARSTLFDFYSCFPDRGVQRARWPGHAADDPRPLTVTGGLPFFGGAGNNYSMHAIASMVRALRAQPARGPCRRQRRLPVEIFGRRLFRAAGALDRFSTARPLQAEVDALASAGLVEPGEGEA